MEAVAFLGSFITLLLFVAAMGGSANNPKRVSIIQLLANPEKFNTQKVSVEGFYSGNFENYAVYLSVDDARHSISANSIWIGGLAKGVDTNRVEDVNNDFVLIEGTFHYSSKGEGHLGGWASEITDVTLFVRSAEVGSTSPSLPFPWSGAKK